MKNFIEIEKTVVELNYTTCDKCGLVVQEKDFENEIVNIEHTFGFGSKQDGTKISFDLCEACFMEMIKDIPFREEDMPAWE